MKTKFLLLLVSLIIFSCNKKSQDVLDNFLISKTISSSSQISIKLYDNADIKRKSRDIESFIPIKEFKTVHKRQIERFEKLFTNAEKTGYCCCPTAVYSIHFLNRKEEIDLLYVDTIESKDKIRIYEKSFQYSYIIDKKKWKSFLDEIKN